MIPHVNMIAPPLNYRHRRLPNGLNVYALPDRDNPNVAVHVWYQVGSKDDPQGRSGFAHLFEHLMFKATRNMPAEFIDRLTEDVGGYNNASTYDDFTNYYEVVPAHHLERILWAEAERMGSLIVEEAVFKAERDVVIEELRERVFAEPYGKLFYLYLAQANYEYHPYGRPGIGSIEDLEAATLEDVRAFHKAFYRPDNAVIVISGNFEDAQLDEWVDRYFANINSSKAEIPRKCVIEPPRTKSRVFNVAAPTAPLAAITISWPGLAANDEDLATLYVLDAILSRGESSRLYQSAVYESQIATEIFSLFEATKDPSVYTVGAIIAEGQTIDDGAAILSSAIASIKSNGVSEEELSEARNEILTEKLQLRETADGRAFELAEAVSRFGDASMADRLLNSITQISADDIMKLANRLFKASTETIIRYGEETRSGAATDTIETAPTINALSLDQLGAQEHKPVAITDTELPLPRAPRAITSLQSFEMTLDNGLRVIVSPKRGVPLIGADLKFSSLTKINENVALDAMASLSMKGTHTRSARQIAQAIEALGASITTSTTPESSTLSVLTRTDTSDAAFDILADIVMQPAFRDEDLQRLVRRESDELSIQMSDPSSIAFRVMTRILYDGHFGAITTPEALGSLTRQNMLYAHERNWRPDEAILAICGDIAPEDAFSLSSNIFREWRAPDTNDTSIERVTPATPRCVIIDMPDAAQAAVVVGLQGPARNDAAYMPTLLATAVLGGGYSARLNTEIRVKRGLSYGAGARLTAYRTGGKIIASTQTRNDAAALVLELIENEAGNLADEVITDEEMTARKAALIGGFGRSIETTAGVATQLANLAHFDLPMEVLGAFVEDVEKLNAEHIRSAAAKFLLAENASVVIVGDARQFEKEVLARRPQTEKVSLSELNLNTAALR